MEQQQQQQQQNKETKADKIRTLLAQGMEPRDIAATVGTPLQTVYDVQYRDRRKAAKARAKQRVTQKKLASTSVTSQAEPITPTIQTTSPTVRISARTGLPVRPYNKTKTKAQTKKPMPRVEATMVVSKGLWSVLQEDVREAHADLCRYEAEVQALRAQRDALEARVQELQHRLDNTLGARLRRMMGGA